MMFSFNMLDYTIQLEETRLIGMTFIDPYCNIGSFINEVLSYSKLCYFGPL